MREFVSCQEGEREGGGQLCRDPLQPTLSESGLILLHRDLASVKNEIKVRVKIDVSHGHMQVSFD